jgi:solute carrier family 6 amino acid transporter-like protein 5/7/9/14
MNDTVLNWTQKAKSPSEEFFENHVLGKSSGIDEIGVPGWHLVITLLVGWIFIFFALSKGVKTSGKVVYVTATLPYFLLFALLIRAVTLDGSVDGILRYVVPDLSQLTKFRPWGDAAMQLFYSTGAAWGALITLASYNKFKNNFYRDAVILSISDTLTAFLAGFVIFATLGFMAKETNLPISSVVTDGPGLVFIVYPAAIARMPFASAWAILFFIFLFTVGVDSQFGMFETVLSALFDRNPFLRTKKTMVTALISIIEFLAGIILITNGGIYVFQIMDWYSSTFSLMILSLTECFVISWIYGAEKFYFDMSMMLGYRPCRWWGICWRIITPILTAFILLVAVVQHTPVTYGDYQYPTWAIVIGWLFALCSILPLPLVAIVKIAKQKGPFFQRLDILIRPSPDWGPSVETGYQEQYQKIQQQMMEKLPRDRWQSSFKDCIQLEEIKSLDS